MAKATFSRRTRATIFTATAGLSLAVALLPVARTRPGRSGGPPRRRLGRTVRLPGGRRRAAHTLAAVPGTKRRPADEGRTAVRCTAVAQAARGAGRAGTGPRHRYRTSGGPARRIPDGSQWRHPGGHLPAVPARASRCVRALRRSGPGPEPAQAVHRCRRDTSSVVRPVGRRCPGVRQRCQGERRPRRTADQRARRPGAEAAVRAGARQNHRNTGPAHRRSRHHAAARTPASAPRTPPSRWCSRRRAARPGVRGGRSPRRTGRTCGCTSSTRPTAGSCTGRTCPPT